MNIDPDEVFAKVEADRLSAELAEKITTATIVYYASDRPGIIEQLNRETGERKLGTWCDGTFVPLEDDA